MLFGILGWIVIGLVLGFIASRLVNLRGDDPRIGIGLGAIAAAMGGWLYSWISENEVQLVNALERVVACIRRFASMPRITGLTDAIAKIRWWVRRGFGRRWPLPPALARLRRTFGGFDFAGIDRSHLFE